MYSMKKRPCIPGRFTLNCVCWNTHNALYTVQYVSPCCTEDWSTLFFSLFCATLNWRFQRRVFEDIGNTALKISTPCLSVCLKIYAMQLWIFQRHIIVSYAVASNISMTQYYLFCRSIEISTTYYCLSIAAASQMTYFYVYMPQHRRFQRPCSEMPKQQRGVGYFNALVLRCLSKSVGDFNARILRCLSSIGDFNARVLRCL